MLFASAFKHSSTLVAVVRAANGEFVDVNPAFERRLGHARSAVVGRRPIDIGLWPDIEVRTLIWSRLQTGDPVVDMPLRVAHRDGRISGGRLTCEPFEHADEGYYFCCIRIAEGLHPATWTAPRQGYQALFQAAAEGLYRSLPDGGFIDVNPAMARLLGFESPEAMLRLQATEAKGLYVLPGRREELRAMIQHDGFYSQQRSQIRRRDGALIWVSENCRAVRDELGRVALQEGSVVDITEALAAEAALQQSEALYKVLVDSCSDGVFLTQGGIIRFCNQAMADIFGCTILELTSRPYIEWVHPDDVAAQAERRRVREQGSTEPHRYEIRMRHHAGHYVTVAVHADAVMFDGAIASTGLMRDVTEEHKQQQALQAAERCYRELFEGSPIGLFKTHADGRILEVNPVLLGMLGYTEIERMRESLPTMGSIYLDPLQRKEVLAELGRHGVIRDHEVLLKTRSGERLLASINASVIHSADGVALEFAGSVIDVTHQRDLTEALARSETRYRTLVEHSQVGVFITSGEQYVYVNHALTGMFGYEEQTLLAMNFRQLVAPEQLAQSERRLAMLRGGEPFPAEFESCYLRKDGSRFWVRVSCSPIEIEGVRHLTGMILDITRHREAERRLRFHATHDSLTGLPNRLMFQQALESSLAQARASGVHEYAVLFLDLDGFKLVNDSLGHAAGDLLLVALAEKMSMALTGEALVARYGGDEFTILPHGACDHVMARELARRVLDLFEAPIEIGEQVAYSSASIGIVLGRPEYRNSVQLLRDADTAMYRAKAAGKAGYVMFDDTMHGEARSRFELERDLRAALRGGQFEVHYQPLVRLADAAIIGCEALVRWNHPQRGVLLPGEFLPVAEEMGLIAQLDGWVLETACDQIVAWQITYPAYSGLRLNVNLDDRQMGSPTLIDEVAMVIEASGIDATSLSLEVTETVFRGGSEQAERTRRALEALKGLGVGLVVDDFGTGYSSLESFASAPFDALKIDRGFIRDMETNPRHRAIVRTIVAFASDLGLTLTAEGVESQAQSDLLQSLGCTLGQGYLYSPALDAVAFERLLNA
ncbi:MAG: PAS domain S-box protein [Pseudomarimonas sp.]